MVKINGEDKDIAGKNLLEYLNEAGYTYSFTDLNNIYLRNGIYSITSGGLDEYPSVNWPWDIPEAAVFFNQSAEALNNSR